MQDLSTYLEYRNYGKSVRDFRKQVHTEDALYKAPAQFPPSAEDLLVAKKRGEMLKRAVDDLDEYSQTRMKKVETVTQTLLAESAVFLGFLGGGIGKLFQQTEYGKKLDKTIAKKMGGLASHAPKVIPGLSGLACAMIANIPLLFSLTTIEIQTARIARAEVFKKDLSHPNDFAILTDEQIKQANEMAKTTELPPEEKEERGILSCFNIVKQIKSYMAVLTSREFYRKDKDEYDKTIAYQKGKISELKVSPEEIKKAKESRDVVQKLASKVDFESQDYIQKAFVLVDSAEICLFGFGVVGFWVLEKLKNVGAAFIGKSRPKITAAAKESPVLSAILSAVGTLFLIGQLAEYRNDAIRIARHKNMNELMKDPSNFLERPAGNSKETSKNSKPKKNEGWVAFIKEFFHDRKEYFDYLDTQGVENEKFKYAARKLKLAPEQLKDARLNKTNFQKMVNKLDDKKRHFEENFEIFVELLSSPLGLLAAAFGDVAGLVLHHIKKAPESHKSFYSIIGTLIGLLPAVAIEVYTTIQVRQAARVSYSEAHKQLGDEKDFLDYSNIKPDDLYMRLAFRKS